MGHGEIKTVGRFRYSSRSELSNTTATLSTAGLSFTTSPRMRLLGTSPDTLGHPYLESLHKNPDSHDTSKTNTHHVDGLYSKHTTRHTFRRRISKQDLHGTRTWMTWIEMRLSMSHPYFPLGPRDPMISKVIDVTPDRRGSATRPIIKLCERGSCLGCLYASRVWGSETRQACRVRSLVLSRVGVDHGRATMIRAGGFLLSRRRVV